ncbi:MAG: hypothetical protein V4547_17745 [Bacteroidota bacterium]
MAEEDVASLKRDVQEILFYLKNDNKADRKGLIAEVAELKKGFSEFVTAYKTDKAVKKGQLGVIATIGAGVALVIEWLIKTIW